MKTQKMNQMLEGYLECMLWSCVDDNECPLDQSFSLQDVSEEALAQANIDCHKFLIEAQDLVPDLYSYNFSQLGHDFWLTRNRHGAGFWDGDYPKTTGDNLTNLSHSFQEVDPYVGEEGKIHL